MSKFLKTFGLFALLLIFATACSTEQPGSSSDSNDGGESADDGKTKIGLSISTLNNPFFVSLRDGAEAAAEEAGYEIVTADAQNDPAKQVNDIEDLLQQNIDVLLVNPADSAAVVSAIESANGKDVPVITVDRSAEGGEVVSHIASDNVVGGEMAGKFIAEQLSDEGKVVELEGIPGASATRERGKGFHNIVGAVQALESNNMLEDVIVVGFDATDDARAAVSEGRMDATIAQQPELIGEKAIDAAGKVGNGEEIKESIPVELKLVKE